MNEKREDLYELLVALTGEDPQGIRNELDRLIAKMGLRPNQLSENDVRKLMALYLEEIQIENDILIRSDADVVLTEA